MKELFLMLFLSTSLNAGDLPDKVLTPGKADPHLTEKVICAEDFKTGEYRNVSSALKTRVYREYGVEPYKGYCSGEEGCEVDHLIPIYVGGANDITNLWPQPYEGQPWNARMKDRLEVKLHNLVCDGTLTLDQAQREISTNWIDAYKKYVLKK